jgi:hypothetical protein
VVIKLTSSADALGRHCIKKIKSGAMGHDRPGYLQTTTPIMHASQVITSFAAPLTFSFFVVGWWAHNLKLACGFVQQQMTDLRLLDLGMLQ